MTSTTAPLVTDSVTMLGADARGRAAIAASHGGIYAAYLAAKAGLKAVILSDAGVGRERAGVGGLAYLATMGVPAAAIGHRTARIGDGVDCAKRGIITYVNEPAAAAGIRAGMHARVALDLLAASDLSAAPMPAPQEETRRRIAEAETGSIAVLALDSASLVEPQDVGAVVLTGSHGALLGGRPETAMKVAVFAAVFNDADRGIDDCGVSRLPALDARNIAGATVSAWSARIGDGLSTYRDGIITAVNETAARRSGEIGIPAAELVTRLVAASRKESA
ncbi:MAG TPA: hypothetical protein VGX95_03995 [Xanthobacteraceae bacterium]|jgi:hypothetical protein|nr:hypothetical protein [Xanthobacteraceae bacterium]